MSCANVIEGVEHIFRTAIQTRRLESAQDKFIKQSIGLSKLSHNTALLKALNIEKIEDIVNRNVLSLYEYLKSKVQRINRCSTYCVVLYVMAKRYMEPYLTGWCLWASHQVNEPLILNMYPKLV